MYKEILPFGEPFFYEGEYQEDKVYPLYIQSLLVHLKLKEGKNSNNSEIKHSDSLIMNI